MADDTRRDAYTHSRPGDSTQRSPGSSPMTSNIDPRDGSATPNEQIFSVNEHTAAIRSSEEEALEPAPVIYIRDDLENHDEEDDSYANLDNDYIHALLRTNEDSFDYYTILGLSRDPPPTASQIRAAYHRLSLAFHPDKHPQHLKAAAERHFTKLQRAYETLIEPRKRVIYDLEGEEGVRNEYILGGAMGQGGEGENQIGLRTMGADEFRKWFITVLGSRERRNLAELVGSKSACKLILDARGIFGDVPRVRRFSFVNDVGQALEVPTPFINAQAIKLHQTFSIPLPGFGRLLRKKFPSWKEIIRGEVLLVEDSPRPSWEEFVKQDIPKFTVTTSISGELVEMLATKVADPDVPEKTFPSAHLYNLESNNFQISTRLEHTFSEDSSLEGQGSITSAMQGMEIDVSAGIFPKQNMSIGVGRPVVMAKDTTPFQFQIRTNFNESLHVKPPIIECRISRPFGGSKFGYVGWSSGDFAWPAFTHPFLSSAPLWLPRGQVPPNMKVGFVWKEPGAYIVETDDDADIQFLDPNGQVADTSLSKAPFANKLWHLNARSSTLGTSISMTYGCDLFVRSPEIPVKSRIMNSGDAVRRRAPRSSGPRGVRMEVEVDMNLDLSLGGVVRGVRRVGTFTMIGVGIGLNPQQGIYISFSWSRLGHNIVIPVILLSAEEMHVKALLWALAVPWATYAAIEFLLLRPILRRQRRRLIREKRREMRVLVMKRKTEAAQAVVLMEPLVHHRQAAERAQGGLVIIGAHYYADSSRSRRTADAADVTVALAALVHNGQLSIARGVDKAQIIGFWDPAPLQRKRLTVDYLYNGRRHRCEIVGDESLSLPARMHALPGD